MKTEMTDYKLGKHCFECFTDEQKAYLTLMTDPYHDSEIKLTGAPSSVDASSVLMTINQEESFSATNFSLPSGTSDKWDVNIALFPCAQSVTILPGNIQGPSTFNQFTRASGDGRVRELYPLTLSAAPTGQATFCSLGATGTDSTSYTNRGFDNNKLSLYSISDTSSVLDGRRMRLVSQSFEVVNETPSIYDSGAVTTYEVPNQYAREHTGVQFRDPGSTVRYQNDSMVQMPMPPPSQKAAALLKGSQTWKASKGAYIVGRKCVREIPFKTLNYDSALLAGSNYGTGVDYDDGAWSAVTDAVKCTRTYPPNSGCSNAFFPFNISGCYITGLSAQYTVLRVRYRTTWEIIPSPTDSSLVPLATPTMPFDSVLEDFLQDLLRHLPTGTRQTDNPNGEWWRTVLNKAGKVAKDASLVSDSFLPGSSNLLSLVSETAHAGAKLIPEKKKVQKNPTKQTKTLKN